MIEDIARSTEGVAANTGHADRPEAIDQDARLAIVVEEADAAVDKFGIALEHTGADAGGRSGRAEKKNATETNRQLELRSARFDGSSPSREYVQGAIEKDRV